MARVTLIDVAPRNAATGATVAVRLAGGGSDAPYYYGSNHYRAGITGQPAFQCSINFDGGDFGTGGVPQAAELTWKPSTKADLAAMAAYFWPDAAITVRIGEESATGVLPPVRLTGKVLSGTIEGGGLKLALSDPAFDLKKPLLTARYGGTGGLDGPAEWDGKIKRRIWGRVWNLAGQCIDKANNIYCYADPSRAIQAIDAVRDKGAAAASLVTCGWAGSAAATFAALQAAVAPSGGGVVCPSIACVKWWTAPAGDLTADLRGETGLGYVETTAEIVERIVQAGPATPFAAGTVTAARTARPAPIGYVAEDEYTTVASIVDTLLGNSSLLWLLDANGQIVLREWAWGASGANATSLSVSRKETFKPVVTRKIGYRKNQTKAARGDLAAIVLVSDVAFDDGSTVADLAASLGPLATSGLPETQVNNLNVATGGNICATPSFESGSRGMWDGGTIVSVTGQAFAKALQITPAGGPVAATCADPAFAGSRATSVSPGDVFFFDVWVDTSSITAGFGATIGIDGGNDAGAYVNSLPQFYVAAGAGWQRYTFRGAVPSGVSRVRPFVYVTGGTGPGRFANILISRAQPGADVTASNVAAAVVNQGPFTTYSDFTPAQLLAAGVGGNLVWKSSFKDGSVGRWGQYSPADGAAAVPTAGPDGTGELRQTVRDLYEIDNTFSVTPTERIYVEAWCCTPTSTAAGGYSGHIGLYFTNASGGGSQWVAAAELPAGSGWTKISGWVTVPAGAAIARPWLVNNGYGTLPFIAWSKIYMGRSQSGSDVTGQNISAAIAGQTAWATYSGLTPLTVYNRIQGFLELSTSIGDAAASVRLRATTDGGATYTSSLGLEAQEVIVTNSTGSSKKRAMSLVGGNATFDGDITVGGRILFANGLTIRMAVQPVIMSVYDGQSITYPNAGYLPIPAFATTGLAALGTGETYNLYLESQTASGATVRLKIVTPGTPGSTTLSSDAAGGSGNPTRVMAKGAAADSATNQYEINTSWKHTGDTYTDGGGLYYHDWQIDLTYYAKVSGSWVAIGTFSDSGTDSVAYPGTHIHTGSNTITLSAPTGVTDFGVSAAGGSSGQLATKINTVTWASAGTPSTTRSASPAGQQCQLTLTY